MLKAALERLVAAGVRQVALGSVGADYIWPGVPTNLPVAVRFFTACGWSRDHVVADLVGDVRRYARPRTVYERASAARVSLAVAGDGDLLEVLTFERRWFPNWVRWFESPTGSILLARDDKMRSWAVCCSPVPVNARSSGRCSAATWLGSAAWGSQSGLPAPGLAAPWSCGRPSCCGTLEPGCAMSAGPGRQLFMSVWATGRGDAT